MSLGFLGTHDFKATRMGFLNFQGIFFFPNMKLLSCDFLFQAHGFSFQVWGVFDP